MSKVAYNVELVEGFTRMGNLANPLAAAKIPYIVQSIEEDAATGEWTEVYSADIHPKTEEEYLASDEGRHFPIYHCAEGGEEAKFISEIRHRTSLPSAYIIEKPFIGTRKTIDVLLEIDAKDPITVVKVRGFLTGMCVLIAVLMIRAWFPHIEIIVDSQGCADLDEEKHEAALEIMKRNFIAVI